MGKFILAGGPNTGKSSVAKKLAARGYAVGAEAARQIIAEQQQKAAMEPGYAAILPWTNFNLFQRLVLMRQLDIEARLKNEPTVFLDRSLIDPVAYAEIAGGTLPPWLEDAVERAGYRKAFLLAPLPVHLVDAERRETPEQAAALHERLVAVYRRSGIECIDVPLLCPGHRTAFILDHLA